MSHLKVFISNSVNPHLNLATEEWIFHNLDPNQQILFLWRNDNTVVIGRNQNPWSECNLNRMKEEQVHLARRTTGGGAVFHDLGNTNFTLLSPKSSYKRENNIHIILSALQGVGIKGFASGRNDLMLDFADGPRKFSGSAYREKNDRAFHHGTLLINANLQRLGHFLTPNPKKLLAKGKESVRARVANLVEVNPDLNHDIIVQKTIESFQNFYQNQAEVEYLNIESLQKNNELNEQYLKLSSWDWLYGNTLEFTHQMDQYLSLGFFDFKFKVDQGIIQDLQIFSDSLYPKLIEDLRTHLIQKKYQAQDIQNSLEQLKHQHADIAIGLTELTEWLSQQIEI